MKEVSPEEARHMAELSRLRINEEEEKLFCAQFTQILNYMNILSSLDTEGVEPCYTPIDRASALRDDEMEKRRTRGEILANAPETDGAHFIVPRII